MKINLLQENITDWRGSRIAPGAVVLYHCPSGRNPGLIVEGIVRSEWTSPTGWIKIRTLRGSDHNVAVANAGVRRERITVITPADL